MLRREAASRSRSRRMWSRPPPILGGPRSWLRMYDQSATEYGGTRARIGDWLAADRSPMAGACGPMRTSFVLLFDRARPAGAVLPDVTAIQVLTMISALPKSPLAGPPIRISTSYCTVFDPIRKRHGTRAVPGLPRPQQTTYQSMLETDTPLRDSAAGVSQCGRSR